MANELYKKAKEDLPLIDRAIKALGKTPETISASDVKKILKETQVGEIGFAYIDRKGKPVSPLPFKRKFSTDNGLLGELIRYKNRMYEVATVPMNINKDISGLVIYHDCTLSKFTEDLMDDEVASLKRKNRELTLMSLELKKSQQRLKEVAYSSGQVVWETDLNGHYRFVSGKAEQMTGYSEPELIGKSLFDMSADTDAVISEFSRCAKQKRPINEFERMIQKKDGTPRFISTNGFPIYDSIGRLSGYRGVDRDITEQKKTDEIKRKHQIRDVILKEVSSLFAVTDDLDGSISSTLSKLMEYYGTSNCYVTEINGASINATHIQGKEPVITRPSWWIGHVREGLSFSDAQKIDDPKLRQHYRKLKIASMIAEPMVLGDELTGYIALESKEAREWTANDIAVLQTVAEVISLGMHRHTVVEQLEKANFELRSRVQELEKFQKITIGRELKMIELKQRIRELEGNARP